MLYQAHALEGRTGSSGFGVTEETGLGRLMDKGVLPCRDTDDVQAHRAVGLCDCDLKMQNAQFAGTGGVSGNNREAGFAPAYLNTATGEAIESRFRDGQPAPVHVLDGLPESWIAGRDADGCVTRASDVVVAGFLRNGRFFTRQAAASALAAMRPD